MRILVTGGAGFIGSHVVEAYAEAGHEVGVLDNFSSGSMRNLLSAVDQGDVTVFEADLCDADKVASILGEFRPEVVNHHAALVDVTWCEEHEEEALEVNARASALLLEWCSAFSVRRFIFASSVGGYGECLTPATEEDAFQPIGVYGRSKALAEELLSEFQSSPTRIILRYANVYGPRTSGGVVRVFTRCWSEQERPRVYGDGEQVRDFVHVRDVARANLLALDRPELPAGSLRIYNIASGHPVTINRLWTMISAELLPARPAEILMSRIDAALAAEELGFEAQEALGLGLSELLRCRTSGGSSCHGSPKVRHS